MRVRALDSNGDYQLGQVLVNNPECVKQCIQTKLGLWLGEWFLDIRDGTDWLNSVMGYNSPFNLTIQDRILVTPGVQEILNYNATIDSNRNLTIQTTIQTIYSITPIDFSFVQPI